MPDAAILQAQLHAAQGRTDQAVAGLRRFLQRAPANADANKLLAELLTHSGELDQALYFARRALSAAPSDGPAHGTLGKVLQFKGDIDGALEAYRAAIRADPALVPAWIQLGLMHHTRRELAAAIEALEAAVRLDPASDLAIGNLALIRVEQGRVDDAIDGLRRALAVRPDSHLLRFYLCFALNYDERATPDEIWREHQAFGRLTPTVPAARSPVDASRKIRIGYLSGDFRSHSVAYFVEPILSRHDRARFHIACYSYAPPDSTTDRLRTHVDLWRDLRGMDGPEAARVIRADGVDVLVDLGGLTSGACLGVVLQRAAPKQVSMIGYPNTTGVPTVDARIVDAHTDPPGAESRATERLIRMPGCFLCYGPPESAPEPAPPPCLGSRPVTFGSFNALPKIGTGVMSSWARILDAVPGSRLLIKARGLDDPATRESVASRFGARGIGPDRLELLAQTSGAREHLALYGRVDIALDTFPYNGATTTCEALWMGVPVIALAGAAHAGRVGLSLLTAAGLSEFASESPDGYEKLAVALARDPDRLARLRTDLRARVAASALCDAARYTRALESALDELVRGA